MKKFFGQLADLLADKESIVVATIFDRSGSAPRTAGAKMAIRRDGMTVGTIGGGRLEADAIRLAGEVFLSQQSVISPFDLSGQDVASMDMICGGQGEILLDFVDAADEDNRNIYQGICEALARREKAWLITAMGNPGPSRPIRQQCLVKQDGSLIGRFEGEPRFLAKLTAGPAKISIHAEVLDGQRYLVEPIRHGGTAYIFGAGHVSQKIAPLAETVGFRTVVLDDRIEYANRERFPEPCEIVLLESFERLPELAVDGDCYIIIVTRGHLHDKTILEWSLRTDAGYIGMIGSRRKRDKIYTVLARRILPASIRRLAPISAPRPRRNWQSALSANSSRCGRNGKMRATARLAALLLAAGYSSRASGFKPLLPLGGVTVIESAVDCFRRAGITEITVVTGHRTGELSPFLGRLPVLQVFNADYEEGMFSSVVAGLRTLRSETDAFFLLPADMPLVASHTIRLLARAYQKTGAAVVHPAFRGLRGHPPLISTRLVPAILAAGDRPEGLRSLLASQETAAYELAVLDEGVLLDIDTLADYQEIAERRRSRHTPSRQVCEAIVNKLNMPEDVVRHGTMVAAVAGRLAAQLNGAGLDLDAGLLVAAGLFHDLAKGRQNHARAGARLIKSLGYPQVASVVATHTDITFAEGQPLDEAAVIYLVDKLVDRDRIVSVDERFRCALTKFAADAGAQAAVNARLTAAHTIARQVEKTLGLGLAEAIVADSPTLPAVREG